MSQIVVTNSLPQSANVARMGSKIEVIDISGGTFYTLQIANILYDSHFSGMVSEFIRRSHYNESVRLDLFSIFENIFYKVSVLSGRYFKLTDKEAQAEHKERKISDVGIIIFNIYKQV